MTDDKFKRLFELARGESPPPAPDDFTRHVMAGIRRERRAAPVSLWEQIGSLFPRLAIATALVIGACALTEFYYSSIHPADLNGELGAVSEQLRADNGD